MHLIRANKQKHLLTCETKRPQINNKNMGRNTKWKTKQSDHYCNRRTRRYRNIHVYKRMSRTEYHIVGNSPLLQILTFLESLEREIS
jgi:hypothetical protein